MGQLRRRPRGHRPEPARDHRPRHTVILRSPTRTARSAPCSTARSTTSGTLRERLLEDGHTFTSRGDTEVIAHLAEDHDAPSLARRLDGMFAFAVWDSRRERLLLGRDRLGKKPLYYWAGPDTFVFASEIKGVLAHPAVPCELDERALPAYLTFGYVPTPFTFFDGIRSVPPAHVLSLESGGRAAARALLAAGASGATVTRALDVGLDEAAAEVRARSKRAIRRRLIADVPLGAFLSGGIDSSAIVALMASVIGEPVKTFTIGFDDRDGFDERPFARARRGALRDRAPRVGRAPRRGRADRAARLASRPAVRRLERDPDLPAQRSRSQARHRRAVGRRWRRAVRRLRALRRRRRGRSPRRACPRAVRQRRRARSRRRCRRVRCAAAWGASSDSRRRSKTECHRPTCVGSASSSRPSASACSVPPTTGRCESYRREWEADRRRPPARPAAGPQPRHLPARRPARQDRPDEHGPRARGPLAVPRHRARRVRDPAAPGGQGPRSLAQASPQARGRRTSCPTRSCPRPKHGFGVPLDRWFRASWPRTRRRCWGPRRTYAGG